MALTQHVHVSAHLFVVRWAAVVHLNVELFGQVIVEPIQLTHPQLLWLPGASHDVDEDEELRGFLLRQSPERYSSSYLPIPLKHLNGGLKLVNVLRQQGEALRQALQESPVAERR